jgi:hypothetical protein
MIFAKNIWRDIIYLEKENYLNILFGFLVCCVVGLHFQVLGYKLLP